MTARGVIYSDFDGVYNIPQRRGLRTAMISTPGTRYFRDETTIAWDSEILNLFGEFIRASGFELIWLTTWNEQSLIQRAAHGMEFPHRTHAPAALNHRAKGTREWTEWKAHHIIEDQTRNPRPFIWIDDKAPNFWRDFVEELTAEPSLIITTDSAAGLTKEELLQMVLWLQGLQDSPGSTQEL